MGVDEDRLGQGFVSVQEVALSKSRTDSYTCPPLTGNRTRLDPGGRSAMPSAFVAQRHGATNARHVSNRERAATRSHRSPYTNAATATTTRTTCPWLKPTTTADAPAPSHARASANATARLTLERLPRMGTGGA